MNTKNTSNVFTKKPSFLNLVMGSLIHSLGLNKVDAEIRQFKNIDGYRVLQTIEKENGYMDCSVGCYIKNGKKFFIKTYLVNSNYRKYFIFNEWLASKALYKTLKSQSSRISTPKPIKLIGFDESVSLVYEFIDGKTLSTFSTSYQTKVFIQIIKELNKISALLTKDETNLLPKRSFLFYLISLPYLSFLTFFRTERNFKIVAKAFFITLKMLLSEKLGDKLFLAHRDLKPHNIIIKESKIFLIDTGRMALTLPGYDLALLSLDPAQFNLYKSLEKNLNVSRSSFLTSYIAIQFADSTDSVGKKYWEFLKSKYENTSFKKDSIMKSNDRSIPKINRFSVSLLLSKSILVYRYLYHLLFSNFYHLGTRVTFKEGVTIHNGKHISLGDQVYLEKNVTLKFLEEFENSGYKIPNLKIENNVFIGTGTIIAAAKSVYIKKDVLIAPNCFIGDHDHEYSDTTVPIKDQGYKNVNDVTIEERAWIAANSVICSGVTIGKNSVVGASSVVKNNIPPFALAVGNPARVVKKFNVVTSKWEKIK